MVRSAFPRRLTHRPREAGTDSNSTQGQPTDQARHREVANQATGTVAGRIFAVIALQSYYFPSARRLQGSTQGTERRPTTASITIRNLDDAVKTKLRVRAATNGRSMEEEARIILREAVEEEASEKGLGTKLHELFEPLGGVQLEIPPREPMRDPPRFG